MRLQEQWMCLTSSRGKEVVAREMGPHCDCCKRKCSQVFNEEERKDIFSSYWSSGEVNVQRVYCWLCKKKFISERLCPTRSESRKKFTSTYSLFKKNDRKAVCRKYFLNTLGIKQDFVYGAITIANDTGIISQDDKGKHKNDKSASQDNLDEIKNHIKTFPRDPFYYCRHDTSKLFLEAGLSLSSMYRFYVESQRLRAKAG